MWTCPLQYSSSAASVQPSGTSLEMKIHFSWIVFLILPYLSVTSKPIDDAHVKQIADLNSASEQFNDAQSIPKHQPSNQNEQIISVRITSSIAVDRGKGISFDDMSLTNSSPAPNNYEIQNPTTFEAAETTVASDYFDSSTIATIVEFEKHTDIPPTLAGANLEFIKQLQAKKGLSKFNENRSFQIDSKESDNVPSESEIKTTIDKADDDEDVPLARSVPLSYSSKRYLQDSTQRSQATYKLTTVNFNVLHDMVKENLNDPNSYVNSNRAPDLQTFYSEPAKVYSQPAQVYSVPAKFYSEPAKIYSEPAKIYSQPAKIYSEPAKIYSEPAKFYSQPASLHLGEPQPSPTSWKQTADENSSNRDINTTPITFGSSTPQIIPQKPITEYLSEKNYEVDEKDSVITDGQSHGERQSSQENCKQENCKVGYVVEGRQFRKYRLEERTPDGFIVGEYGVVRNEDGALRGVRYTADSEASPRLIHDALMKFLQLKK